MNSKMSGQMHYESAKGILCGSMEVRPNEIPSAMNELDKSIAILQDELSILYGKLNPIMRSEPSQEDKCLNEAPDMCVLGGQIRSSARRVAAITKDVRIVLDMLEI